MVPHTLHNTLPSPQIVIREAQLEKKGPKLDTTVPDCVSFSCACHPQKCTRHKNCCPALPQIAPTAIMNSRMTPIYPGQRDSHPVTSIAGHALASRVSSVGNTQPFVHPPRVGSSTRYTDQCTDIRPGNRKQSTVEIM